MNIFYVDARADVAAKCLADEHIRKMQIESAQMLSTAHWITGGTAPYKSTHKNHPSSIWVRKSIQHYRWLVQHGLSICDEFELRYGKVHKTKYVLEWLRDNEPNIPDLGFTEPPQCMPIQYHTNNTIDAYRTYYIEDKVKVKNLRWRKLSNEPNWIQK